MDKDYHQEALKGTRQAALEAVKKIEADLKRHGSSGHRSARKHQLIFSCNVLSAICGSCQTLRKAAHYDIYVDIYMEVIAPQLDPTASPSHWRRLLTQIEYLFLTLAEYNIYAEAHKLYAHLSKIQFQWPEIDDLKYLLDIHGSQLKMLMKQSETKAKEPIKKHVSDVLSAVTALWEDMIKQPREKPTDCTTLLRIYMASSFTRLSVQTQLATTMHCAQLNVMYTKLFELLKINSKLASAEDVATRFQAHIEALHQFIQIDMQSKLQEQLALQYARILRNMDFIKGNEFIGYCCALFYNLLKLVYVRERSENFKEHYAQLLNKFSIFLTRSGEALIQTAWFQDFFALVHLLFYPMQMSARDVFDLFWQQMDASLYMAHIKLIKEFVKITPLITKIKLIQFSCCKDPNNWFHIQMNYTRLALEAYAYLLTSQKSDLKDESTLASKVFSSTNSDISTILQNSIDTLISMENECSKSSEVIRKLCFTFAKLLREAYHSTHASSLISLATQMTRLRSRISTDDWIMIIRYVHKNALICGDAAIACEILACYIAELLCHPTQIDFTTLHSFIQVYHNKKPGICLFDKYTESTSPFKPLLQNHEKRIYHWIEAQYVFKLYDMEKDSTIFRSVAQRSQTQYDFINIVHAGKLIDQPSLFSKVQSIYDTLRDTKKSCGKSRNAPLTRLRELTLAHAIILLILKRSNEQKSDLDSKYFQEANFVELLQEKIITSLSLEKEMETIKMALEALHAFEAFFNKADAEPLPSKEGFFIDWSHVVEDLTSLAVFFQSTGYLEYAMESWLLQYRVTNTIDDVQSSFRALSFFCEYNAFFDNDRRLNIFKEVENKNQSLINTLEDLPQLLRREQNFTLCCLCQVAYFHASKSRLNDSQTLLRLVKHVHKNVLQRDEDKYDIVLFTADIVNFRILWKHMPPAKFNVVISSTPNESSNKNFNLLHEIHRILDRIYIFVQISSADMKPCIMLLLSSSNEFADYAVSRLCGNALSGYMASVLKSCLENGFALRTVQLLSKWALINLQMENLRKAEIKMLCIECILGVRDFQELASLLKATKSYKTKEAEYEPIYGILPPRLEEVRRVAVIATSPLEREQTFTKLMKLDHKLKDCESPKENVKSPRLSRIKRWSRFELNCLIARLNFLQSHFKDMDSFYENCEKWLEKRKDTFHFQAYQSTVLVGMVHRANFLRANKNYEKAISHLEMCIGYCTMEEGKMDAVYLMNFKLQLEDTRLEQLECKARNLPLKKKPEIMVSVARKFETTPAAKPNKYAALPMTTCKKPTSSSAVFAIYSDRKSPRKGIVKHTKPMTAIKGLKFTESGSSSGNESSAECKTNKQLDLNSCQLIELSDSDDDCDDAVNKSKDSKPVAKEKIEKSKGLQQKTFKFFESIELEDFGSTQTLVKEMQNLAIETKPVVSKTESADVRTRRRSPRLNSEINKSSTSTTAINQIHIDNDDSPTTLNVPVPTMSRTGRKRTTKRPKTPEASTTSTSLETSNALEARTSGVITRTRRVRQATAVSETVTSPTTTSSLRRRQRN